MAFHGALAVGVIAAALAAVPAHAATRYVSRDGHHQTPFTNWYMAATNLVNALLIADGDVIVVSNGVYHPSAAVSLSKGVIITSLYGAAQTIIDGGGQAIACFNTGDYPPSFIYGLTISNFFGGGAVSMYHGTLTLANSVVAGNRGSSWGGMGSGGGHSWLCITNCVIRNNTATGTTAGGGIYTYEVNNIVTCLVYNSEISVNSATAGASVGGMIFRSGRGGVENCLITDNSGDARGGVQMVPGGRIANSIISGNLAGGVWMFSGSVIENCLLFNNYGAVWGTGVRCEGGTLRNCTVVSNYSSQWRPGIYLGTCVNCIVYSNFNQTGASANYDYCDSVTYSASTTTMPAGAGNIVTNPMLVNMPFDCRLLKGSPCINKGTNENWMSGALDLGGHSRIVGGTVDMGAYEWFPAGAMVKFR